MSQMQIAAADTLNKSDGLGRGLIGWLEDTPGFFELSFQVQTGDYVGKVSITILRFVFCPEGGKTGGQDQGLGPALPGPSRAAKGVEEILLLLFYFLEFRFKVDLYPRRLTRSCQSQ